MFASINENVIIISVPLAKPLKALVH